MIAAFFLACLLIGSAFPFVQLESLTALRVQANSPIYPSGNAGPSPQPLLHLTPQAKAKVRLPTPTPNEATPTRLPTFTPLPLVIPRQAMATPVLSLAEPVTSSAPLSGTAALSVSLGTTAAIVASAQLTGTTQATVTMKSWLTLTTQIDGNIGDNQLEVRGIILPLGPNECLDLVWWPEGGTQFRSFNSCEKLNHLTGNYNWIEVNLRGQFSQGIKYHYAFVIYNQKNRDNSVEHMQRVSDEYEFVYTEK